MNTVDSKGCAFLNSIRRVPELGSNSAPVRLSGIHIDAVTGQGGSSDVRCGDDFDL